MTIKLNTYFELTSTNNIGESISFVVAEKTFKTTVMTSSVAKISFCGQYHLCGDCDSF